MNTTPTQDRPPLYIRILSRLADGSREAFACFALALREALKPGLAFTSVVIGATALAVWTTVLIVWWGPIWFGAKVVAGVVIGGLVAAYLPAAPAAASITQMANIATTLLPWFAGLQLGPVFGILVLAAGFVLSVMLSMRVFLELFLMGRIQRYCLKRYPSLETTKKTSFTAGLRSSVGTTCSFVFFGFLCLIIPVFGGVLFFLLASYLNVRSLINDAAENLVTDTELRALIGGHRVEMVVLGVLVSIVTLIPFLGFFAPVLLGASVCHLCMRSLSKSASRIEPPVSPRGGVDSIAIGVLP